MSKDFLSFIGSLARKTEQSKTEFKLWLTPDATISSSVTFNIENNNNNNNQEIQAYKNISYISSLDIRKSIQNVNM